MTDDLFSKSKLDPAKLRELLSHVQLPDPATIGSGDFGQIYFSRAGRHPDQSHEFPSWKMHNSAFTEFKLLLDHLSTLIPRRLNKDDIASVNGSSFRGTSVFLLVAACYASGGAYSIRDISAHKPDFQGEIEFRYPLASPDASVAGDSYGNKYIEKDGSVSTSFQKMEGNIFSRIIRDNGSADIKFPAMMLQPVLVGFNAAVYKNHFHKGFEGSQYSPIPNQSTLLLLSTLLNLTVDEFARKFPILSASFQERR